MTNLPHLAEGLEPEERLRLVLRRLSGLGFSVVVGDSKSRSMTNPLNRRITLAAGSRISPRSLPLLAHELAHAERQGSGLASRLAFAFAYVGAAALGGALLLLIPFLIWYAISSPLEGSLSILACVVFGLGLIHSSDKWRAAEEVEGEAHEAAMRARIGPAGDEPKASHRLGDFRSPYYLRGRPEKFDRLIEARAAELIL